MSKFPFSSASPTPAPSRKSTPSSPPKPARYGSSTNNSLQTLLAPQGTQYVPAAGPPLQVTSSFLRSFNHAASLSSTLYPAAQKIRPQLQPARGAQQKGMQNATLSDGGKRISSDNAVQQFTWNAQSAASAQLTAKDLPLLQFQGTWSTSPAAMPSHTAYICRARS